jgi:hypothetical protein
MQTPTDLNQSRIVGFEALGGLLQFGIKAANDRRSASVRCSASAAFGKDSVVMANHQ